MLSGVIFPIPDSLAECRRWLPYIARAPYKIDKYKIDASSIDYRASNTVLVAYGTKEMTVLSIEVCTKCKCRNTLFSLAKPQFNNWSTPKQEVPQLIKGAIQKYVKPVSTELYLSGNGLKDTEQVRGTRISLSTFSAVTLPRAANDSLNFVWTTFNWLSEFCISSSS